MNGQALLLITLLSVALAFFFATMFVAGRRRLQGEEKVLKGYFLLGLSGLMAKIAMADGRVTGDEAELACRIFHRMDLSDAERATCIGNFVTARRDGLEVRDHAKRFMAYSTGLSCEFLYYILWRVSRADGSVDPAEEKLLREIAVYLNLGESVFESFKAGKQPRYSKAALQAAGVPQSLLVLAN